MPRVLPEVLFWITRRILDTICGGKSTTVAPENLPAEASRTIASTPRSVSTSAKSVPSADVVKVVISYPRYESGVIFSRLTIVNRLNITPDSYLGYEITTFTTSADGTLFADVLTDLGVDAIVLDASAGKFSGATVVDFPPQMVSKMRLVIQNRTSGSTLGIRALSFTQRSYQATGAIVSTPQTLPTGAVMFSTDELVFPPYVSITHQISSDTVNYTNVLPGPVTLGPQWWYRALLSRASTPD